MKPTLSWVWQRRTLNCCRKTEITQVSQCRCFMPYRFDFDPVNKILRAYFEGQVDDEEMRRYYFQDARKIVAKLHFDAAIVDFSAVTKFDLSSSLVNEMAAYKPVIATVPIFIV